MGETTWEETGYNLKKSVNPLTDRINQDGSTDAIYRISRKPSKTVLDKELPPMSDRLWMDYDGDNYHDIIKGHQTYINSSRRKRHDLYGDTVALPSSVVRIEFMTGDHRGCQYVYGREEADKLVASRRAFIVENQMESKPLRTAEVFAAINAARKRDGVPLLRSFAGIHERQPGEEG